jgi:hypothetical protein
VDTSEVPELMYNLITKPKATTQTGIIFPQKGILIPIPAKKATVPEIIRPGHITMVVEVRFIPGQGAESITLTAMEIKHTSPNDDGF